ncbi:MAG: bifunctional riboflavin kinase/FAD synthetase [Rhodospirillales bacterium]
MVILPAMQLYRHHTNLPPAARSAALAIGNFDGVHRGHRAVIALAGAQARELGRPFGLLTFEPHPREVLRPDGSPFRLTDFRTKVRILEGLGLDLLYVLPFVEALYSLPAETFVSRVLHQGLGVAHAAVGDNFYFGAKRGGTPDLLVNLGRQHGFTVSVLPRVAAAGQAFSSTAIRRQLAAGDMAGAALQLGRPWEIVGRVLHGAKRGRELGMPTANIDLGASLRPAYGVYAVRVALDEGKAPQWRPAVANLGISPMFAYDRPLLEVHLLDFSGDLYGRRLRVALIERLRAEMTFDGLPALMAQMQADAAQARSLLEARQAVG